ncbi:MAG: type III pantothenate kinase [Spirochaetes bacterium]|nr:type III pantothenate kinase [Spirochaetota bacterium]
MILAFDIGNTNIEIGVLPYKKDDFNIIASARYYTRLDVTSDQMALFVFNFLSANNIDRKIIKKMIFSSVVPPLNNLFIDMFKDYFSNDYIEVNEKTKLTITNCYKNPREVGSDRLVNAQAVYHLYKKDSIIVDMGTATTLCVLTRDGKYLGGTIVPGITTSVSALINKAARLPSIKVQKQDTLLAEDTTSAIESGVYFSNYYAVKGMIGKLVDEVKFKNFITIGTGGSAKLFADTDLFNYNEPILTLKGLKIILDLNT